MLLVFELVSGLGVSAAEALSRPFRHFLHTGYGHFFSATVSDTIWVLTVLYFARTETFWGFLKNFGLRVFETQYLWFVIVVVLGARLVSHTLIVGGHLKGATTISLLGFARTVGPERFFYLAPALVAAFTEEICLRGFLYTAFRRSYSIQLSMALLLALTLLTHSSQVLHSAVALVVIGSFALFQCYLWERTGNLWNCIIGHFLFNLSGAFISIMPRISG
jgi:membrane protease YdiL (CAAX protease family)